MTLCKKRLLRPDDRGFSLIEVIISVAIMGLLGLGAAMASAQVLRETTRNNDYTTASRNAMNAVYWMSRDAQMAQIISGVAGFPATSDLSLSWTDWENSSYNATYAIENGRLVRSYTVDDQTTETLIAEYVNADPNSTNCTSNNGTLILTITCSVGEGSWAVDVTRVREMVARPGL